MAEQDTYRFAVYGASGAMGREILGAIEGEGLPIAKLVVVGGPLTVGSEVTWRNHGVTLSTAAEVDIDDLDLAVLAVPGDVADSHRQALIDAGALVVDLSHAGAAGGGLPLVWPELGVELLDGHPGGFALPCALATTLAPVLSKLASLGALASVEGTVLVGGSNAGRQGEQALSAQTVALLGHRMPPEGPFGGVLAFNVIPGSHRDAGTADTGGADPIGVEAAAQLSTLLPDLPAALHFEVVQIPIFAGIGVQLTVRWESAGVELDAVERAIDSAPELLRVPDGLALRDAVERDEVFVARVHMGQDGAARLFVGGDPVHRIGRAVATLVSKVIEEDLW